MHFMRNILAYMPVKDKNAFGQHLKAIWLAPTREQAYMRAEALCQQYERRSPKSIRCLETGLEDLLAFYAFPQLDARKIFSNNTLERLKREIWRLNFSYYRNPFCERNLTQAFIYSGLVCITSDHPSIRLQ